MSTLLLRCSGTAAALPEIPVIFRLAFGRALACPVLQFDAGAPLFAIEAMEEERPSKRPSKAPAANNVVQLAT